MTAIGGVGRPVAFAGRILLWAAVAIVLVRGVTDLLESEPATTLGPRAEPSATAPQVDLVRAQAFAVRFASAFATFDPADRDARLEALRPYLADGVDADLAWVGDRAVRPLAAVPVSADSHGDGRATVVVAIELASSRWVHLAVPMAGDGERFVVTALPAVVPAAAPARGVAAASPALDDGLAAELRPTVEAFFRAYAAQDQAALDRYAVPGRRLEPLATGFTLEALQGVDVAAAADEDGRRTAWATVRWADTGGGASFGSTYELGLVRQDGRWYVETVGASRG